LGAAHESFVNQIVMVEGFRSGAILGACSVALALVGLAPAFAWLPEIPLVGAAILLPLAILGWTGFRAALRSGRVVAGPLASALTGAVAGGVAGLAYLLAGKPALNIGVGLLAGAIAGAAIGFVGALFSIRSQLITAPSGDKKGEKETV
jgi:hypothetical protein